MDQFIAEVERPVYRFLLRLCGDEELAGDLTQETLMRGWEKRLDVRDDAARHAWLFRIALNTWKDRVRRRGLALVSDPASERLSREPAPDETASCHELGLRVWRAIDELPERQQQVMHLRVIEQLEIKEIADILQIDRQLVRSNLAAARQKLRARFQHEFDKPLA